MTLGQLSDEGTNDIFNYLNLISIFNLVGKIKYGSKNCYVGSV